MDLEAPGYFHGMLQCPEAECILKDEPPGAFIVREERTGQLIISYRSSPLEIGHVLVPAAGSPFIKKRPFLVTLKQVINYIVTRWQDLKRPVPPDESIQFYEPTLARSVKSNKNGLPPGYCLVCEEVIDGDNNRSFFNHFRRHHVAQCSVCEKVMLGRSREGHQKICKDSPGLWFETIPWRWDNKTLRTYGRTVKQGPEPDPDGSDVGEPRPDAPGDEHHVPAPDAGQPDDVGPLHAVHVPEAASNLHPQ